MLAVCLGWAGVEDCLPKGRAGRNSGCTCCSLRLLCGGVSTCSHGCCVAVCVGQRGITGRPFTPSSDCCLQPLSLNAHSLFLLSAPSFLFLSFTSSAYPPVAYMPDYYLPHFILCIPQFVCLYCLSLSSFSFFFFFKSFCVSSHLFLHFNSHRDTNINSSSWEPL